MGSLLTSVCDRLTPPNYARSSCLHCDGVCRCGVLCNVLGSQLRRHVVDGRVQLRNLVCQVLHPQEKGCKASTHRHASSEGLPTPSGAKSTQGTSLEQDGGLHLLCGFRILLLVIKEARQFQLLVLTQ